METKISCIYLWKWNNFVYSCERESIVYILLWKLKYFVYFCKSESILYTVVKVKVFGNIWQIATSALTQASFTDWKWNLTHRASFRNIYKKTSQGKFDRIKGRLILIISTVHHPSTEHWEQPYLAYLKIEARLNTHKLRPCKNTNLTFFNFQFNLCPDVC